MGPRGTKTAYKTGLNHEEPEPGRERERGADSVYIHNETKSSLAMRASVQKANNNIAEEGGSRNARSTISPSPLLSLVAPAPPVTFSDRPTHIPALLGRPPRRPSRPPCDGSPHETSHKPTLCFLRSLPLPLALLCR